MALCIISTIIVYFFVCETKCITVEELGALFGDKVVVHLTSDGHGIVEDGSIIKVKEEGNEELVENAKSEVVSTANPAYMDKA